MLRLCASLFCGAKHMGDVFAFKFQVAVNGSIFVEIGEYEARVSAHLEEHGAVAQVQNRHGGLHPAAFQGISDAHFVGPRKRFAVFSAVLINIGQAVGRFLFKRPFLFAHKTVFRHAVRLAVQPVSAVPESAHCGEENRRASVPIFRYSLPEHFPFSSQNLEILHFCASRADRDADFSV